MPNASNSRFVILLVKNVSEPSPLLINEGKWAFCWCMMSLTIHPSAVIQTLNLQ
ncbi:unnamed protein product [Eruca vesicaria subsp. sativa]|uniref:Uncharacterized protein n=1 Tax=Eruca vesicaria subsp. sativa TaxID=29727 RepID=A0ABC8JZB2_ERUVS|nr:unnamed protein product [Eruca vesicaria subsp. sativa]